MSNAFIRCSDINLFRGTVLTAKLIMVGSLFSKENKGKKNKHNRRSVLFRPLLAEPELFGQYKNPNHFHLFVMVSCSWQVKFMLSERKL